MATVAADALYQRLMRSGLGEQLQADIRTLTGVEFEIVRRNKLPPMASGHLVVPFWIGKVMAAALVGPAGLMPKRKAALQRTLEMIVEGLGHRILHQSGAMIDGAIPGTVAAAARILRERGTEEDLTLPQVAKEVGLGRERLSRLFHASLGVTFSDYLNLVRLDKCRHILRNGKMSVTDAAFASGFQSVSQFNRRFKAAEGMSPREFVRRHAHVLG